MTKDLQVRWQITDAYDQVLLGARHDTKVPDVTQRYSIQRSAIYATNTVFQCIGGDGVRALFQYITIKRFYTAVNFLFIRYVYWPT